MINPDEIEIILKNMYYKKGNTNKINNTSNLFKKTIKKIKILIFIIRKTTLELFKQNGKKKIKKWK
jgi:hypothetical protein